MGFSGEDLAVKVRGKCNLAREHFAATYLNSHNIDNEGGYTKKKQTFRKLINPIEYNANVVYIREGILGAQPIAFDSNGEQLNSKTTPTVGQEVQHNYNTFRNIAGYSNFRGYLQPMTLEEYCTFKGYNQNAARIFLSCWSDLYYSSHNNCLLDLTTRLPNNEFETYKNKIVPVITWYYDKADGTRDSYYQNFSITYGFTANKSLYTDYQRTQLPLSGSYSEDYVAQQNNFDTCYYFISAPYVSSKTGSYQNTPACGANLNGVFYSKWNGDDRYIYVDVNENPYYTMLALNWSKAVETAYEIFPITSGAPFSNVGVSYSGGHLNDRVMLPVFNSVEDIIALFADYGVIVTTDWDEVLNPTPTPEESATPNPDPTDREIPNFPDNTTDYTPVEPAYITPSTFGQSCIYTPTTTRDFLRWVCDNTVDIGNWARLFANPADVITGINLYNLDIVAHDSTHVEAKTETNILGVTTPIPNYTILGGYNNIVDGGTLHLQAYYGNYADFTSMTYQMYVPFVGFTTLRACDVVNKTLHLYYAVDFATGSAVAFVNSDDKLIYTSPCTVAGKIPLSTSDRNSQMINNTLSVLGGLSGLLGGVASGNVGGGVGALMGGLGGLQMQTNYSNKGSLSSVNIYKLIPAFIERTRYDLFLPSNDSAYINARYQTAAGAPSTQFDTLLNCVDAGGFVQSDVVYLTSQTATETEKQQIISLIKSGIYL